MPLSAVAACLSLQSSACQLSVGFPRRHAVHDALRLLVFADSLSESHPETQASACFPADKSMTHNARFVSLRDRIGGIGLVIRRSFHRRRFLIHILKRREPQRTVQARTATARSERGCRKHLPRFPLCSLSHLPCRSANGKFRYWLSLDSVWPRLDRREVPEVTIPELRQDSSPGHPMSLNSNRATTKISSGLTEPCEFAKLCGERTAPSSSLA